MESLFSNNYWKDIFKYDVQRGWCESDYTNHTYIAEFWNTTSNIVLLLLSLYGIYWHYKLHQKVQRMYIVTLFIAIGSALFHATLSRIGQLADELPMLLLCTLIAHEYFKWKFLHFITAVVAIIYTLTDAYAIFMVYFSAVIGLVIILPMYMKKSYLQKKLYHKSITMFIIGYSAWIIDIHVCNPTVQSLHFHSWWHVFSGFGLYWYIQYMMARSGKLQFTFPLEVIKIIS